MDVQVAQYCQEIGDFRGAIEFLLMAQRSDEAFNLAKAQNQVHGQPFLMYIGLKRGGVRFTCVEKRRG
jgi:hypothetical protein